jgi:hypothetical protein
MTLSAENAETIGLQCLAWLAGNDDLLPVFLGSTGLGADDLRARAQEPEFLGSVLDFVLMNDIWVIGFCTSCGLTNDTPMRARAALPGGETMHWT